MKRIQQAALTLQERPSSATWTLSSTLLLALQSQRLYLQVCTNEGSLSTDLLQMTCVSHCLSACDISICTSIRLLEKRCAWSYSNC